MLDRLVGDLADPDRWPETTRALVEAGDRRALPALVRTYDSPVEADKLSLLQAIERLGGAEAAHDLVASADPVERRIGVRLMHLVPDGRHLAELERLVSDPDPVVAAFARRALATQWRTAAWYETAERLAESTDPEVRQTAEGWLAKRPAESG